MARIARLGIQVDTFGIQQSADKVKSEMKEMGGTAKEMQERMIAAFKEVNKGLKDFGQLTIESTNHFDQAIEGATKNANRYYSSLGDALDALRAKQEQYQQEMAASGTSAISEEDIKSAQALVDAWSQVTEKVAFTETATREAVDAVKARMSELKKSYAEPAKSLEELANRMRSEFEEVEKELHAVGDRAMELGEKVREDNRRGKVKLLDEQELEKSTLILHQWWNVARRYEDAANRATSEFYRDIRRRQEEAAEQSRALTAATTQDAIKGSESAAGAAEAAQQRIAEATKAVTAEQQQAAEAQIRQQKIVTAEMVHAENEVMRAREEGEAAAERLHAMQQKRNFELNSFKVSEITEKDLQKAEAAFDSWLKKQESAELRLTRLTEQATEERSRLHGQALQMDAKMSTSMDGAVAGTGRMRLGLQSLVARMTGTNTVVAQLSGTLMSMGMGGTVTVGVLGGLAALMASFRVVTEEARKQRDELKSLNDALLQWYRTEQSGDTGKRIREIEAANNALAEQEKRLTGLAAARRTLAAVLIDAATGGIGGSARAALDVGLIQKGIEERNRAIAAGQEDLVRLERDGERTRLQNLIRANTATEAERKRALEVLAADRVEMASLMSPPEDADEAWREFAQKRRAALADAQKGLEDALKGPKVKKVREPKDEEARGRDILAQLELQVREQRELNDAHDEGAKALSEIAQRYQSLQRLRQADLQMTDQQKAAYRALQTDLDALTKAKRDMEAADTRDKILQRIGALQSENTQALALVAALKESKQAYDAVALAQRQSTAVAELLKEAKASGVTITEQEIAQLRVSIAQQNELAKALQAVEAAQKAASEIQGQREQLALLRQMGGATREYAQALEVAQKTQQNVAAGMDPDTARQSATEWSNNKREIELLSTATDSWTGKLSTAIGVAQLVAGALQGTGSEGVRAFTQIAASVQGAINALEEYNEAQSDPTSSSMKKLGAAGAMFGAAAAGAMTVVGILNSHREAAEKARKAQEEFNRALENYAATSRTALEQSLHDNAERARQLAQQAVSAAGLNNITGLDFKSSDELAKYLEYFGAAMEHLSPSARKVVESLRDLLPVMQAQEARIKAEAKEREALARVDLEVRRLTAAGKTEEAEALRRQKEAQIEINAAIKDYGKDSSYVSKLREILDAEREAADAAAQLAQREKEIAQERERASFSQNLVLRRQQLDGDERGAIQTRSGIDAASQLASAKALLDAGTITQEMFEALARILDDELNKALGEFDDALKKAAEAAAKAKADALDELAVRALVAQGRDAEAEQLRTEIANKKELEGVTDEALIAQYKYVQGLEAEARAKAAAQLIADKRAQQESDIMRGMIEAYRTLDPARAEQLENIQTEIDRQKLLTEAVDDATRARYEELFALQDAAKAALAAAAAQKKQAEAAKALASLSEDIELEFLRATGRDFDADVLSLKAWRERMIAQVTEQGGNADLLAKINATFDAKFNALVAKTMDNAQEAIDDRESNRMLSSRLTSSNIEGVTEVTAQTIGSVWSSWTDYFARLPEIADNTGRMASASVSNGGQVVNVNIYGNVGMEAGDLANLIANNVKDIAPVLDRELGDMVSNRDRLAGLTPR